MIVHERDGWAMREWLHRVALATKPQSVDRRRVAREVEGSRGKFRTRFTDIPLSFIEKDILL